MKIFNFYIIIFSILLTSFQSIKDGLSCRKTENSDEFLVKKKNPLVMPPKFMELPKPQEENNEDEIAELEENVDIKTILELEKSSNKSSKNSGSAEDFVLKQLEDK